MCAAGGGRSAARGVSPAARRALPMASMPPACSSSRRELCRVVVGTVGQNLFGGAASPLAGPPQRRPCRAALSQAASAPRRQTSRPVLKTAARRTAPTAATPLPRPCRFVVKRDGRQEPVHFDKITARITKLSYGLNPDFCDPVSGLAGRQGRACQFECRILAAAPARRRPVAPPLPRSAPDRPSWNTLLRPQVLVAQKVTTGVYKGVTTTELDELAAETAASMTASHPDYALVRARGLLWEGWAAGDPAAAAHAAAGGHVPPAAAAAGCQPTLAAAPRARSWPPASRSPTCTRTR